MISVYQRPSCAPPRADQFSKDTIERVRSWYDLPKDQPYSAYMREDIDEGIMYYSGLDKLWNKAKHDGSPLSVCLFKINVYPKKAFQEIWS